MTPARVARYLLTIALVIVSSAASTSCGGISTGGFISCDPPHTTVITSTVPSSTPVASSELTLVINGSGFHTGAVVEWIPLFAAPSGFVPSTLVSNEVIRLQLPANMFTTPGQVRIKVWNVFSDLCPGDAGRIGGNAGEIIFTITLQ